MNHCKIGKIKMKKGGAELRLFNNDDYIQNNTLDTVEGILSKVKTGEIIGIGFITVNKDFGITSSFCETAKANPMQCIVACELLKNSFMEMLQ